MHVYRRVRARHPRRRGNSPRYAEALISTTLHSMLLLVLCMLLLMLLLCRLLWVRRWWRQRLLLLLLLQMTSMILRLLRWLWLLPLHNAQAGMMRLQPTLVMSLIHGW